MKRLALSLMMLLVPLTGRAQEWEWLYPYPTTNPVIRFYFLTQDIGFIITDNGEILKTTDGCSTWTTTIVEDTYLYDIYFFDKSHGWIIGRYHSGWSSKFVILQTVNGGDTWNSYEIPYSYDVSYNCLHFISETTGWIAGRSGHVMMTTNGGISWNDRSLSGQQLPNIFFIYFTDNNNGVVIGRTSNYGIVFAKTSNGGTSWQIQSAGIENTMYGGCYISPARHYAVGTRGLILQTTNYGGSWSFPSNSNLKTLYSTTFSDETNGWAVGEDGTVLHTTNGGESWQPLLLGVTSEFVDVKFLNTNTGWILGSENGSQSIQAFLQTTDGGQTWKNKFRSFEDILTFRDVSFVNSNEGWLISYQPYSPYQYSIFQSKDGGKSWDLQKASTTESYYGLFFVDPSNGWCVGKKSRQGLILRTTDGGATWTSSIFGISAEFSDAYFISNLEGWVVGDNGTILHTTNGGNTWEIQSSGITNDIVDIFFLDKNHGWAAVNSNRILRTVDGGVTWSSFSFTTSYYVYGKSIYFTDSMTGWLGTDEGLYKSVDGGKNWNKISLPDYDYVVDIYFTDKNNGWALTRYPGWYSSGGIIYHTTDGGSIWNKKFTSSKDFWAFSFVSEGYGWAVGENSTIAFYNPGGAVSVSSPKSESIPSEFSLYQNYPNPFNPSTTIVYDLPEEAKVELKIYDVLGREVTVLVNEVQKPGRHQVKLNLDSFATGTYFYQLKANNFVKTKKLMLMK